MLGMLTDTEQKLTQLVEQGFTREALHVLMDANALHRELSEVLAASPRD